MSINSELTVVSNLITIKRMLNSGSVDRALEIVDETIFSLIEKIVRYVLVVFDDKDNISLSVSAVFGVVKGMGCALIEEKDVSRILEAMAKKEFGDVNKDIVNGETVYKLTTRYLV